MSTDLRKEYNRLRNTGILVEKCGDTCVNCGSDTDIEYHHIVPLYLGGTNNLRNIVPLCQRCHCAAHNGQHMNNFKPHNCTGRKPKVSDEEAFKAFDLLIEGRIGYKKCQELLKIASRTRPAQTRQYKLWSDERGIQSIHSTYDYNLTIHPDDMKDGKIVGEVIYLDGTVKQICFRDLGENDSVEYKFCTDADRTKGTTMTWGEWKAEKIRQAEEAAERERQELEAYRLRVEEANRQREKEEAEKVASLLAERARQAQEQERKRLEEAARREQERLEEKARREAEKAAEKARKEAERAAEKARREEEKARLKAEQEAVKEAERQAKIKAEIEETMAIRRERLEREKAERAAKVVPISKQETFKPLTAEEQRKRDAWWKEYRKQYVMA